MTQLTISPAALDLIKAFEGCKLEAYRCPAGVWTIGYGATGPEVRQGLRWTQRQADERLAADVERFALGVRRLLTRIPTPDELGAMTSLAFNIGLGAFGKSTVLRKFNAGDKAGAAAAFALWNKAGGKVLQGLVRRRAAEADLFLSDAPDEAMPQKVEPSADSLMKSTSAKAGAVVAGLAIAQQTVQQVEGIWGSLRGLGIDPQTLFAALIIAAAGVVIYRAFARRRG